ncbi:MAG: hypothetical protein HY319_14515 [Armatimonadetes bacterium]|nr:hypothetical protein [Armatimonadota bacterium]
MGLLHPELERPFRRAVRQGGAPSGARLLQDRATADLFLREVGDDPWISAEVRAHLYLLLPSDGPGGLRAFAWLAAHRPLEVGAALAFVTALPVGTPCAGGLCEREALEVAEALGEALAGGTDEEKLRLGCCLLASRNLSRGARAPVFRRFLRVPWAGPRVREGLCRWALEGGCPEPPAELIQPAVLGLLQSGWKLATVRELAGSRGARALLEITDYYEGADEFGARVREGLRDALARSRSSQTIFP